MRVVRFPSREEHGQDGDEGSEGAQLGRSVAHGAYFEQTCQGAVQGVDAVAIHISVLLRQKCGIPYSNNSPSGLDVPVRRACLPSTLSMVEYIHMPAAKL